MFLCVFAVFAEHYDPEEEDDDEKLIYPKSDEQRRRLGEAVKNILLFRSLDQVREKEREREQFIFARQHTTQ